MHTDLHLRPYWETPPKMSPKPSKNKSNSGGSLWHRKTDWRVIIPMQKFISVNHLSSGRVIILAVFPRGLNCMGYSCWASLETIGVCLSLSLCVCVSVTNSLSVSDCLCMSLIRCIGMCVCLSICMWCCGCSVCVYVCVCESFYLSVSVFL